jgi:5'-phosphate synthase pdxT subunit
LDGLIIPGGESTTIGKLATAYELMEPLRQFGKHKAIWGTCAGAILLAKDIQRPQPHLDLMDIVIKRNAFGRQVTSFEADLEVPALQKVTPAGGSYHAVFIRAPLIESVKKDAQILAQLPDGRIVAAQQRCLLATSFHPELTHDDRFHRYFLSLAG